VPLSSCGARRAAVLSLRGRGSLLPRVGYKNSPHTIPCRFRMERRGLGVSRFSCSQQRPGVHLPLSYRQHHIQSRCCYCILDLFPKLPPSLLIGTPFILSPTIRRKKSLWITPHAYFLHQSFPHPRMSLSHPSFTYLFFSPPTLLSFPSDWSGNREWSNPPSNGFRRLHAQVMSPRRCVLRFLSHPCKGHTTFLPEVRVFFSVPSTVNAPYGV